MSRGVHVFIPRLRDDNYSEDYQIGDAVLQKTYGNARKHMVGIVTDITKGRGVTVLVSGTIPLVDLPAKHFRKLSGKENNGRIVIWDNAKAGDRDFGPLIIAGNSMQIGDDKLNPNVDSKIKINQTLDNSSVVGFVLSGLLHVNHCRYQGFNDNNSNKNPTATTESGFGSSTLIEEPPKMTFAAFKEQQQQKEKEEREEREKRQREKPTSPMKRLSPKNQAQADTNGKAQKSKFRKPSLPNAADILGRTTPKKRTVASKKKVKVVDKSKYRSKP